MNETEPTNRLEPMLARLPPGFTVRVRSQTVSRKEIRRQLKREHLEGIVDLELAAVRRELESSRPRLRTQCVGAERPCPFLACRWHLFLDVNPHTGSVKTNFPGKELEDLAETCALDVADKGGITLEEVGALCNITRERVRQIETRALLKIARAVDRSEEDLG